MEILNLPPLIIHSVVVLLLSSAGLFFAGKMANGVHVWATTCLIVARWNFLLGIGIAIFTGLYGALSFVSIPNITNEMRYVINRYFLVAALTLAFYLMLAMWLWIKGGKGISLQNKDSLVMLTSITLLLIGTALLGEKLVFPQGTTMSNSSSSPLTNVTMINQF